MNESDYITHSESKIIDIN